MWNERLKFIVQFAIVILFAKKLSLTDYGIYQFIWMFINFFSVIGLFGLTALLLSTATNDIINWIKANRKYIIIVAVTLNAIAIIYLFAFNFYFTSVEKILLLILLLLQNVSLLAESLAIKKELVKKLFAANLVYLFIYCLIHAYAIYNEYSITVLLTGLIVATFIKSCIIVYHFKNTNEETTTAVNIGTLWFYLGINDSLGIIVKWIDKWIILAFLPAAQFAIYFNGTYEIPIFLLLLGAVGNISLVEISKNNQVDTTKIKSIFEQSTTLLAAIIFPSFWFLLFYCQDLFQWFFAEKYLLSVSIFKISILILPIRIIYSTAVLQALHKNNLIVKGALLDFFLAVVFMAILYPTYKMQGLALSFVLSTYIQVAYYMWHTSKLLKQKISLLIPFKKLLYLMLISFAVLASTYFLSNSVAQQAFVIIGSSVYCGIIIVI
jgi:O-antigen/teichoic acid export membrane protein